MGETQTCPQGCCGGVLTAEIEPVLEYMVLSNGDDILTSKEIDSIMGITA